LCLCGGFGAYVGGGGDGGGGGGGGVKRHKSIVLRLNDGLWDVTRFVDEHPGEGIHDVFLRQYHGKDVSSDYEHFHNDNEPDEWLERARANGVDADTGLVYCGADLFAYPDAKKRTKARLHQYYAPSAAVARAVLDEHAATKLFVVSPSETQRDAALTFWYRATVDGGDAAVRAIELLRGSAKAWSAKVTDGGDAVTADTAEALIDALAAKLGVSAGAV